MRLLRDTLHISSNIAIITMTAGMRDARTEQSSDTAERHAMIAADDSNRDRAGVAEAGEVVAIAPGPPQIRQNCTERSEAGENVHPDAA